MAEELARNRQALKSRKLVSCEKVIRQAIEQASDTSPTEKFLTRQVTHLKEAWDEYKEAMLKLQEVASQDNVEAYKQAFDRDHFDFKIVRQQAETFMERFNEPEAEEEPDKDELADADADVEKTPTSALWTPWRVF